MNQSPTRPALGEPIFENLSSLLERFAAGILAALRERIMPNKYYTPGSERAVKVRDLFGKIAPRYDLINDLQSLWLHRRWKRKLVELAGVDEKARALDLCCGTGDVALAMAARGASVVGLDFSEAMLEQAARKTPNERGSATFLRGDGQSLPFRSDSYEVVTVAYGLRNLADWKSGLAEMLRVARPGGRVVVLDFGKPSNRFWRAIYFAYLRIVVPVFGTLFCGDSQAYSYIFESLRNYPGQRGVAEELRRLGCDEVRVTDFWGGAMGITLGIKAGSR